MMRTLMVGLLGAIAASSAAMAADLPVALKAPAPGQVRAYDWAGCYVGGNLGGGWSQTNNTSLNKPGTTFGDDRSSGVLGGAQVGCDHQIGSVVLGVQGSFEFARLDTNHQVPSLPTFRSISSIPWLATTTARVGYAALPDLLLYARGGAAWTRNNLTVLGPFGGPSETAIDNRVGWTVGAGVEYRLLGNWSAFAEYNYLDFGTRTISFTAVPGTTGSALEGGTLDVLSSRQTMQIVLAGLNYRFAGDVGPGAGSSGQLPAKAPLLVPVHDWTGVYVGGNIGGALGHADDTQRIATSGVVALVTKADRSRFLGGVQAGYNYMPMQNVVLGLEADVSAVGLQVGNAPDWLGTVRGRAGYVWNNALFYGTGGLAWINTSAALINPGAGVVESDTITKTGWTAGAGVEWGIAPNWTAKLEYLHYDFGTESFVFPILNRQVDRVSTIESIRAGVNYKFDWGTPVFAKY